MRICVDTSVWSLALRRRNHDGGESAETLRALIADGARIVLLGVIVQEILSGLTEKTVFDRLADYLSAFPLVDLGRDDYIRAAALRNQCRSQGIQASTIDFLNASTCIEYDLSLLTKDKDFSRIRSVSGLKLLGR